MGCTKTFQFLLNLKIILLALTFLTGTQEGGQLPLFGKRYTINYKPLETGIITNQKFKSKKITPDKFDKRFKPGFYRQMLCFKILF